MGFLNIYAGSGFCMTHSFLRLFSCAQGNHLVLRFHSFVTLQGFSDSSPVLKETILC